MKTIGSFKTKKLYTQTSSLCSCNIVHFSLLHSLDNNLESQSLSIAKSKHILALWKLNNTLKSTLLRE